MKTAQDYLDEANATVTRITAKEAIAKHGDDNGVFIDVRDSGDIAKSGTIKGAERVARGFIEFAADPTSQFHKPFFDKDKTFYLVCGLGGQAALAGKTLKDMGYPNVINVGGIGDWKDAGGPVED
ncbi:rhodanese-like domain-containing protein [Yoonia sp.]|uniref:rhodanese-like domain-containing protein n=1 Tax=Yoonia sp. TaxID=2212373 RepID=UPI003A4E344C|nr:rhodanese-like domain-containing protein [Loktanella sp.]